MNTLYLATYRLYCSPYMEDSYYEDGIKLIWARSESHAEYILKEAVEVSYSYALDKTVTDLELVEALGEQLDDLR